MEALSARPFLVKMNTDELAATTGLPMASESDILRGMRVLREKGAQWVLITQGPKAVRALGEGNLMCFKPPVIEPVNPIGSGDAVLAGLIHALGRGQDMCEAVKYGIACGAANALTPTSGDVRLEDVERLLGQVR